MYICTCVHVEICIQIYIYIHVYVSFRTLVNVHILDEAQDDIEAGSQELDGPGGQSTERMPWLSASTRLILLG